MYILRGYDTIKDLQQFYSDLGNNPILTRRLESIADKRKFIKFVTRLGVKTGYNFTANEVQSSIEDHTASGQGSYFCSPVGCWNEAIV